MKQRSILIVDDDPYNLEILDKYLRKANYQTVLAGGGARAWELLKEGPENYSLVLLDRMMPGVGGMEVLDRLKAHPHLKHLPVIMQTAASAPSQVSEGIARGVYYYLTKPFNREVLLTLVKMAIKDYLFLLEIKENLENSSVCMQNLNKASFTFRTIEEGEKIVNLLAHACENPLQTALGLVELVVNAVEHGSLAITYQEKGKLLSHNSWEKEVIRRQQLPGYRDKFVTLDFERSPPGDGSSPSIRITIKDQGVGFDWQEYLVFSMERISDPHGRGILMANSSFSRLEYRDNGRCVTAWTRPYSEIPVD